MQIKVFTLPAQSSELMEEEVNLFLRQHKVMTVDRQFNPSGGGYWAIFITYQEGAPRSTTPPPVSRSGKVDYREVLPPDAFARFARFRDIRKDLAGKLAVPAYAIFTDEELSQIAKLEEVTVKAIAEIKGIGKRAEKYGSYFVSVEDSANMTVETNDEMQR